MIVYDGTAPAALERVAGPGNPRMAHAFPEGSDIALCGVVGTRRPYRGDTRRCAVCEQLARPGFVAR